MRVENSIERPIVGLTGGIATGKSTVSAFFKELGASIVDADQIAKEVVAKGRPAWEAVISHFGPRIQAETGEIDRELLGRIIFNDPKAKEALNHIVHPHVFEAMAVQIERLQKEKGRSPIFLDVPLLIETGMHQGVKTVVLVYVPEAVQVERLMARDNINENEALSKIRSQMPIEEKRKWATLIIDNRFDLTVTRQKTEAVYACLTEGSQ